jgi:putative tricarboxylic transport membrane protein
MLAELAQAVLANLAPWPLFLTLLGTFLGIVVGAIPGLTGAMLIALTLPLTFYMAPTHAVVLLVSMYTGSITGGLISATLLRIPGSPSNVMTTFDGFPMAKAGEPGRALGLGIAASFFGGMFAWLVLFLLAKPLSVWATRFGPFELFSLVVMAMVLIATVSKGNLAKGLLSGFLGMLVSMPGIDPSSGMPRLTFEQHQLQAGLKLLPVLIGVFAVSQVITDVLELDRTVERIRGAGRGMFMRLADWRRNLGNMLRSSVIGTWIGILPGVGASVGSLVAYTVARNLSKTPERFGNGSEEGIVASEAANNATVGGALIPLIAMGIPGSVIDAILIGALMIHSIQPGPMLFVTNADVVWAIISSCLLSTIAMYVMMLALTPLIARVTDIPRSYMMPVVLVFCVIGAFGADNSMFDVWVMLAFGLVGFALERAGIPLGPFVIGFILAPLAEEKLRTGLMMSGGSYAPLVTTPLSALFLLAALLVLLWPFLRARRRPASERAEPA